MDSAWQLYIFTAMDFFEVRNVGMVVVHRRRRRRRRSQSPDSLAKQDGQTTMSKS